jgi:hypothetical protein
MHLRQLADADLANLTDLLAAFDRLLKKLSAECDKCPDPDGWGLFDQMDYLAGMGFAACQRYLTTIMGEKGKGRKTELLGRGPKSESFQQAVAKIINAAANHWKHHNEWQIEPLGTTKVDSFNKSTIELLESIDAWNRQSRDLWPKGRNYDYPMGHLLHGLTGDANLVPLVPSLEAWRDDLIGTGDCC